MTGKDLEGSGDGIIEVLTVLSSVWTKETHE
jgi:hypothetical protein